VFGCHTLRERRDLLLPPLAFMECDHVRLRNSAEVAGPSDGYSVQVDAARLGGAAGARAGEYAGRHGLHGRGWRRFGNSRRPLLTQ
jgi:hypothetical protein